tara:strand:- start:2251 stop:4329 length:2079 start_codon:yes stop_codon:yes gene_type:complete
MATIKWLGGSSTASATATNWKGGSIPGANDVALFDNEGLADCAWTLTSSGTLTVSEIVIESTFEHQVILNAAPVIKGLYLNGILNAGSSGAITFQHGSSPNFFGSYKTYSERFILIDSNASYVGSVTFVLTGSATPLTKFDDGNHPIVRLGGGKFAPDYVVPTSTSGKATFTSFAINSGVNFLPDGALSDNDRLKVFSFDAVTMTDATTVDFGLSTVEFTATSSGIQLPVRGATGYPTTFLPYYRKVVLKANTAGHKILMTDNTFLSVEELEIQDGVMFLGPQTATAQGADIRSMKTPIIRGTWSFSQIATGVYRSPRHAGGTIDGALPMAGGTMTGEIEATTITLNAVPSDPATDDKVRIGESGAGNMFQIQTNDGYMQLGPNNSGFGHIQTGASQFYFNQPILIDGNNAGVFAYNDGLKIGTGTSASGATVAVTIADGSTDITVAGNIVVGGTVDGIDIATAVAANTSKVTNATHSGEVTGATALTIADNIVDEANLKVSNSPTNGYSLTAQSGNTGGLTWAEVTSSYQYARLFANSHMPNQSNGARYYMPWADTNYWTLQTTASNHPDIVVTDASTDYIKLKKGGIYQIVGSFEFFGTSTITGNMDMWIEYNTNSSANRNLGTARNKQSYNGNTGAWNVQKTIVIEILSSASDIDVYVSAFCNGNGFAIRAYDDNRTNISITRLGDSIA